MLLLSFVPDEDVIVAISKKLGKRILTRKHRDLYLADNTRDELLNEYVVEINNGSKEWMAVAAWGRWWSNDDIEGREECNIVSMEEWEKEEDKGGNASGGADFVNGGSANKDKAENYMMTMKDDDSNSGGALLLSSPNLTDEHASLSMMTIHELKEKLWVAVCW